MIITTMVRALRPKQWTKNALLFAALIFSLQFDSPDLWIRATLGFFCFSLISSTGYLYNDLKDREADALHPKKCRRPIASGALSPKIAWAELFAVMVIGFYGAWLLSPQFAGVALAYFVCTMSYTMFFKHHVIIDVMMIAVGFLWRAAAGAVVIDAPISEWLLLCTGFLALFLGFNKRRGELSLLEDDAVNCRKNLGQYTTDLLDQFQGVTTSGTIISYALYTVLGSPTPWLLLTLPHVLYGIFRYIYLVQVKGAGDAPDETLLKDIPILLTCLLYVVSVIAILVVAPTNIS